MVCRVPLRREESWLRDISDWMIGYVKKLAGGTLCWVRGSGADNVFNFFCAEDLVYVGIYKA